MADNQQANWDKLNARLDGYTENWKIFNRRVDAFERKVDERRHLIDEARKRLVLRYFSIAIGVSIVHFLSGIDILISENAAVLQTTPLAFLNIVAFRYVPTIAGSLTMKF